MSDQPAVPSAPNDPELDRSLGALGRFSPRQGFVDRVVTQVRVPLPAWARRIRGWFQAVFSGVSGWTILATLSLATAAAWGSALAVGLRYRDVTLGGASISSGEVGEAVRVGASELAIQLEAARDWVAAAGLPLRALALGYVALALVCAMVLWRLMAEPARARGNINVVR